MRTRQAPLSPPKTTLNTAPVHVLPGHGPCPRPWTPTSSVEEVYSCKENDPEPSIGREG